MSVGFPSTCPRPSPSLRDVLPPQRRGMTELDRAAFSKNIPILGARVPASAVGALRKHPMLQGQVLDIAKIKTILADPEDPKLRRVLLRVARKEDLPVETRDFLAAQGATFVDEAVELDYDHWTAQQVLDSIIPLAADEDVPSSFTQTGHIAHMNLRDEWLPYKHIIGQVILDKVSSIRTVVNKLNSIHAQFRYFDMEVLAGEPNFVTTTTESGCTFTFDFSRVYWNSRLHTEHDRLLNLFTSPPGSDGQFVADAMAGVGPFAVPAARRGAYVLGNDLNPESVKWMRENRVRNKVDSRLRVTEMDAREFIRSAPLEAWRNPFARSEPVTVRQREKEARARRAAQAADSPPQVTTSTPPIAQPAPQTIDHFVMNLPDSALEFLDAYAGCYTPLLAEPGFNADVVRMPLVHVHCFTRFIEPTPAEVDICERATQTLGHPVTSNMDGYHLHPVRRVAPNKDMYCLSFRLPREVAYKRK